MAYSTLADMVSKFPQETIIQLTDDSNLGVVDQTKVDDAIATADGIIDSYLRGRYTVPLPTPDKTIVDVSINLSIFELYKRRGDFIEMSDTSRMRYKDSIKYLSDIQKGIVTFTGDGVPNNAVVARTCERVYTKEFLAGY